MHESEASEARAQSALNKMQRAATKGKDGERWSDATREAVSAELTEIQALLQQIKSF